MTRPITFLLLFALSAATAAHVACSRSPADHRAAADAYRQAGQFREAIVEYRNALQRDPRDGIARLQLADTYMQVQDPINAARAYVEAASLLPSNVEAQLRAATMLILARQFEEARRCAEKALEREPDNVTAQVLLANALAGLNQFDAAMAQIEQAIQLDPTRSALYTGLGGLQYASGNQDAAEQLLRQATEVDAASADAHVALANFLWARGRVGDAEAGFLRALRLDPVNETANRALASFYLGSNRAPEAERHLAAIAEKTDADSAWLALADYYISQNRTVESQTLLARVASRGLGNLDAASRLASLAYSAGRTGEGHRLVDDALRKDRSHPRALMTKARFLVTEHRIDDALARAKAAVASDGQSLQARYLLASIHAARLDVAEATREFNEILRLDPHAVGAKIELARLSLLAGQAPVAAQFAQAAVVGRPDNLRARALLVRSLIGNGEIESAERELTPLLAAASRSAEVQWLAGALQLARGREAAAYQSFERALALDPNALEPLDALVALALRDRQPARARRYVDERLAAHPDDVALLVLSARIDQAAGDVPRAEATLRKAIGLTPTNRQPYELLGQLYLSQNRLDAARREFEEAARRDPESVSAHTMVAMILQTQRQTDAARERYQRVLEIEPNAAVAANNLAWLYLEAGTNLDKALELARIAKAQVPGEPSINHTLGLVYLRKDLAALAIPPLRLAADTTPKNASYQHHLGLAYARHGDSAQARRALEAALALNLDSAGAAEARQVLASLQ